LSIEIDKIILRAEKLYLSNKNKTVIDKNEKNYSDEKEKGKVIKDIKNQVQAYYHITILDEMFLNLDERSKKNSFQM
jgi:hypothetical protein